MTPETAIQIELGSGKVRISHFTDPDGRGLVLADTGVEHLIGSSDGDVGIERLHNPQPGEIYIKCRNRESAQVLYEMTKELCDRFEPSV